ncbi:methyltransferase domain-containing protein [Novosphingobium sp. AAP1]|uniref:methyltransferase domain-containing protein n=1 Tax=Novosphingobium sp. AAP1 TaxID=1523413 RepID=UPI0006B91433|nr:methyltransferase domain-containing protein [Novosphingobium sp. AAP1]
MHDTAYRIGGLVMDTYLPSAPARILEIGALNVNGSLRDHSPRNAEYVGLDFEPGEGVDIVITGTADWHVPDEHFDLVMASSVFEHDSAFWRTFLEMCRKTKPGGHIYISAPSNGTVHRYPRDCWRFYPDSGLALEDWARCQGFELTLIESFIAERETDHWNDFCAVFRRGPCGDPLIRDFVHLKFPSTNALNWRTSLTINPSDETQDMRLLSAAQNRAAELEAEAHALRHEVIGLRHEAEAQRHAAEALQIECDNLRIAAQRATEEIETTKSRLHAESEVLRDTLLTAQQEAAAAREVDRMHFASERESLEEAHSAAMLERDEAIAQLMAEIARLEADLERAKHVAATSLPPPSDTTSLHAALAEEVKQITSQKTQCEQRLEDRFREIARLTRLMQERDQAIASEQERAEWLRQVVAVLTKGYSRSAKARLGTLLPTYFAHKRHERWLRQEGLFDANEYTAIYPEVARAEIHPLRHYINHGMREGRVIRQGA